MRYHYTYLIFNSLCGYFYYGVRTTPEDVLPEDDTYMGSSKHLQALYKRFPVAWVKTVIKTYDTRSQAEFAEYELTTAEALSNRYCVNRRRGGLGWRLGAPCKEETKNKISCAKTGYKHTEEWKQENSKRQKGHTFGSSVLMAELGIEPKQPKTERTASDETKQKMRAAKLGKKRDPETIAKVKAGQRAFYAKLKELKRIKEASND
ncbi:NUMOD3 domain-containing DNA-binding protein [Leptothrix discophora]|uniref:NUMOD3 domain-containing DNA-binding protein n=1 Tax=Leptothrix discophora TaxID=89 RepID=A0ABT9G0B8_LEPDI|nr:NUMOD3 domain-containing DNA-binding protein [Leptothrix discophora]MDP4299929.1 NUMOD3 domain-containing DNA-binding protein [Leptothrix discophora]